MIGVAGRVTALVVSPYNLNFVDRATSSFDVNPLGSPDFHIAHQGGGYVFRIMPNAK